MTHNPAAPAPLARTALPARPPRPAPPGPPPDARTPQQRVRVGAPLSLLAVVPGLLGFTPADSLVVIGTGEPGGVVQLTLRYDLPDPAAPHTAAAVAADVTGILAAQQITMAAVIGYGPDDAVAPVTAALRSRAAEADIAVTEALRVERDRYWSYVCANPDCCPPDGTPFDVAGHPVARAFAASGRRVLASRQELAATIAPAEGELATAMRRATRKAEQQVAARVAKIARVGHRIARRRLIAAVGQPMVAEAVARCRAGEALDLDSAAWLLLVLRELRVRDDAWSRMLPEHNDAHTRLWSDLTRLAPRGYAAAPASLLAFVAWQAGEGALANIAIDRALADDKRYVMARLLRRALDSGAPPSVAKLPMTPEQVAANYDAQEAAQDAEAAAAAAIAAAG